MLSKELPEESRRNDPAVSDEYANHADPYGPKQPWFGSPASTVVPPVLSDSDPLTPSNKRAEAKLSFVGALPARTVTGMVATIG